MTCSESNTLVIGRPSEHRYNQLGGCGGVTPTTGCGTAACSNYVGPTDRKLGPRKHREKVREQIKDYVLLMLGTP